MSANYGAAHAGLFGVNFALDQIACARIEIFGRFRAEKKLHAIPPSAITGGRRGLLRGTWPSGEHLGTLLRQVSKTSIERWSLGPSELNEIGSG